PKKEKTCDRKGGWKQHQREIHISDVEDKYFRYFEEHGIENPKELLAGLGVYFTTLTTGTYKEKKAFVFKLHNDSFKYFILDDSFKVIDKRLNASGSDTTWRDPKHDNGQDLYIFEGFADCLKALQMGYNAFTWSGGVQSFGKLADCFEVKRDRKVFLVLDQDEASRKALPKIASAFAEKGHSTYAIPLDFENGPGKDFCDWMKSHTKKDFEKLKKVYFSSKIDILQTEKVSGFPECKIEELETELDQLQEKTAMIFTAPTGLGKTTSMVRHMVKNTKESFVFFCSTIEESEHVAAKVREYGEEAFVLSSIESLGLKKAIEQSRIVITNYGYLGRQGETCNKHAYAESLLKGRTVFCDEVQELLRKMKVAHPLRARYLKKNENYQKVKSCPKFSRKGGCEDCFPGYKRQAATGKGKERPFFSSADENAFNSSQGYSQPYGLEFEILSQAGFDSWEDLENPQKYTQAQGTLFFKELPENLTRSLREVDENSDSDDYRKFLKSLLNSLKNPQIRTEFPLLGESPVHPKEIEGKAKFPMKTCTTPTITGLDIWSIGQIMKYAKKAVFTSATIPRDFYESVDGVLFRQGWGKKEREVKVPPFSFDVTFLKTQEKLGYVNLANVFLHLDKTREENAFVVLGGKQESDSFTKALRKISEKVQK
ncbi:MAG: DEAD/DEAH box helicase family protein, partial [Simkania sp.]|nr:DEAD/DEAH box helicase family protein [Simkania sp.]